jgi:branched-chain amino acid aminotransferase
MSRYIFFNDVLTDSSAGLVSHQNRSFAYGDGFFETMRCGSYRLFWASYHWERIKSSAKLLGMELPGFFNEEYLEKNVEKLLQANEQEAGARVRITFFREDGGLYKPSGHKAQFIMESRPLEHEFYNLNNNGLHVGFYREMAKPANFLGNIKSTSAQFYVLASVHASQMAWDDILILNDMGNVAEGSSSNLFMVKENRICTPALDQGCVDGVMRKVLLDLLKKLPYKVLECEITPDDLMGADEVFLTNAVAGIRWIKGIEHKRYYHKVSSRLVEVLQSAVFPDTV